MKFLKIYMLIIMLLSIQGCFSASLPDKARDLQEEIITQGRDNCKTLGTSNKDCIFRY